MSYERVIARAYGGEPVTLVLIHRNHKLAYLAAPSRTEAISNGESIPVGFPIDDVFIYNSDTYEHIRTEWDRNGAVSPEMWHRLRPLECVVL